VTPILFIDFNRRENSRNKHGTLGVVDPGFNPRKSLNYYIAAGEFYCISEWGFVKINVQLYM